MCELSYILNLSVNVELFEFSLFSMDCPTRASTKVKPIMVIIIVTTQRVIVH